MAELLEKAAVSYNNHCSAGTQLKMLSFYSKKKKEKKNVPGVIQARNCRVTSLTCVSGKVLKTIIKNGTPLYPKDYLIGSNQQFLHRKIMSQSISISGHVKLN